MPAEAPHAGLMPAGVGRRPVTLHPVAFTLTFFFRSPAVHAPSAWLRQTWSRKVHFLLGVVTPSESQVGSQSVQLMVPPFSSPVGTPRNWIRHSVVASMIACAMPCATRPRSSMAGTTARRMRNLKLPCPCLCMVRPPDVVSDRVWPLECHNAGRAKRSTRKARERTPSSSFGIRPPGRMAAPVSSYTLEASIGARSVGARSIRQAAPRRARGRRREPARGSHPGRGGVAAGGAIAGAARGR